MARGTSNLNAFAARKIAPLAPPETSSVKAITLDELENNLTRMAALYWRMLRGDRNLPPRSWLVPRDMRAFLRNIVLLKVLEGGRDYEYRVVGDMFAWAYGANFRGMQLSRIEQAAPAHGTRMRQLYEHVRASAAPLAIQGWVGREFPQSRFAYYETVLLPLGEDGETVDHILVASFYVPKA